MLKISNKKRYTKRETELQHVCTIIRGMIALIYWTLFTLLSI